MADTTAVIVLAAGKGSRFQGSEGGAGGAHKLAQRLGDSSVLAQTLANALSSRLPVVVVTTEAFADVARGCVATRDVIVLPEVGTGGAKPLGMGVSIAVGVGARPHAPGWLVLPGDMPLVRPATLQAVARGLEHHSVVYAQHRGRRGHPVGFAAELYSELVGLSGDEGARRLISRYPAFGVELDDPGILVDIDTPGDLEAVRRDIAAAHSGARVMP
jgi:molybdenum cofactor cytidylyltransferase